MRVPFLGRRFLTLIVGLTLVCFAQAQEPSGNTSPSSTPSAVAAPSAASASSPNAATNPQVVLRAETRLVQLNVIVHDKKGQPIEDLQREDFILLDNGKPQQIALFSSEGKIVPAAPTTSGEGATDGKNAPAPNVFGNRLPSADERPGSVAVILLDALNTSFTDQAYARTQVLAFLRELQPQDRVAIYLLTTQLNVIHEFTEDSKSLLEAIDKLQTSPSLLKTNSTRTTFTASDMGIPNFKGASHLANLLNDTTFKSADVADVNRVKITTDAIEAIANHVSGIPGRKSLIWVSGAFPSSILLDSSDHSPVDRKSQNFTPQLERVARALNQSNLAIYPVDARGILTNEEFDTSNAHPFSGGRPASDTGVGQSEQSTMVKLAKSTGGRAFFNTNDFKGAIRRTLADSRRTYEIGYYPDNGKWDGEYHTLELRVKRTRATLRYRKGYFAVADPLRTAVETQDSLRNATWSPVDATGLGITAKIEKIFPETRKLDLRVVVETRELRFDVVDGSHKASVDAVFTQLDAAEKVVAIQPLTYNMDFKPEEYQRALDRGHELAAPLTIEPSARSLRVVVRDAASGLTGSVTVPLERFLPPANTNARR
jgi:VWFA-related protein